MSSTTISSAITAAAATSATPSSCSTADFTRFPTSDVACAVGSTQNIPSNTSSVLASCCHSAPVERFNGNCGWYCLSVGQSVSDLQSCLMEGGVSPSNVFCNANNSATATGSPTKTGGSSSASSASSSKGAAGGVFVPRGVGKSGLGVLGLVVLSVCAGALL